MRISNFSRPLEKKKQSSGNRLIVFAKHGRMKTCPTIEALVCSTQPAMRRIALSAPITVH